MPVGLSLGALDEFNIGDVEENDAEVLCCGDLEGGAKIGDDG